MEDVKQGPQGVAHAMMVIMVPIVTSLAHVTTASVKEESVAMARVLPAILVGLEQIVTRIAHAYMVFAMMVYLEPEIVLSA